MKRTVSSILCLIMVMSLCFGLVACGSKPKAPATTEAATTAAASEETTVATEETTEAAEETTEAAADAADEDGVVILEDGKTYGEGATSFTFVVTDKDENTVTVTVNTDEETVGAALVALNLVSGSTSEYGLMVDTVNGITLDYNKDGMYWSFYINGELTKTWTKENKSDALTGTVKPYSKTLPLMIGVATTFAEANTWDWAWDKVPASWDYFHGTLDELQVYNVALTAGQVAKLAK